MILIILIIIIMIISHGQAEGTLEGGGKKADPNI